MIGCLAAPARPTQRYPLTLGAVLLIGTLSAPVCHAQESTLIRFEIADQFDRAHTDGDVRGGIVLVVGADKKGSQYQGAWMQALRTSLKTRAGDDVHLVEVADLRGVPFFVKRSVKKKFPSDRRRWVLMDWKGAFAGAYGFEAEACNILLFDRGGKLLYRAAGRQLDEAVLEKIRAAVDDLIAGHDQGPEGDAALP